MARPEKSKRICHLPTRNVFTCSDSKTSDTVHILTIEEFECIRLIDYIGLTQEQCAQQMHVARTTIQRLYTDARHKMAAFLIEASTLEICGGNYMLCENNQNCCQRMNCEQRACGCTCEFRIDDCYLAQS